MPSLSALKETAERMPVFRDNNRLPENADEYGILPGDPRYALLEELLEDRNDKANAALIIALCASVKAEAEMELAIRLAGIDLFSDSEDGALRPAGAGYSGGDWYAKAKDTALSSSQKAALAGSKLREKIAADAESGISLLLEKRISLELEALNCFLDKIADMETDGAMLSRFCMADDAAAAKGFAVLTSLKTRIDQKAGYFTGNEDEDQIVNWFITGGSYFAGTDIFLFRNHNDQRFNTGLLELYDNYAEAASFTAAEAWQETLQGLRKLFSGYGLNMAGSALPDAEALCRAIFNRGGDFSRTAAQFMAEFDKQFSVIPEWLGLEIDGWKNSIIEYIAANALSIGTAPFENIEEIEERQKLIDDRYRALNEYCDSILYADAETYREIERRYALIKDDEILLHYQNLAVKSFEKKKTGAANAQVEQIKHWRQYLVPEYLKNQNNDIVSASSWKEGDLLDTIDAAVFDTSRINGAFLLYSQSNSAAANTSSGQLQNRYRAEVEKISRFLANTGVLTEALARLGRGYEYSRMTPKSLKAELEKQYSALKVQEDVFDAARNKYLVCAQEYSAQGSLYDIQYNLVKKAYDATEEKRFEYEIQDAIRRWASTAYLEIQSGELENARERLAKSRMVLSVLSDIYDKEDRRPYKSPEYQNLYSKYEQSFNRKMVITKTLDIINSEIAREQAKNADVFRKYQQTLHTLGTVSEDSRYYASAEDRAEWSIMDVIILKDGLLAFSRDDSMTLDGLDAHKAELLRNYFNDKQAPPGERQGISQFDAALGSLSLRMEEYFKDENKFSQWGLAREYLIASLIQANEQIVFLQDKSIGLGELEQGKSLGNTEYMTDWNATSKIWKIPNRSHLLELAKDAWDTLSPAEQADLEFYVILTLDDNTNNYLAGFFQSMLLEACKAAHKKLDDVYSTAKKKYDRWWIAGFLFYKDMRDVNRSALRRIEPVLGATQEYFDSWKSGLLSNIEQIKTAASSYADSCGRLDTLDGNAGAMNIGWDEIAGVIALKGGVTPEEISIVKIAWDQMLQGKSGTYSTVSSALAALMQWAASEEEKNRQALENRWAADSQKRLQYEAVYNKAAEDFIAGKIDDQTLRNTAGAAFGTEAAALKNHLENLRRQNLKDLGLMPDYSSDYFREFSELGSEYVSLAVRTLDSRFGAELAARETEWNEQRRDIAEKYQAWNEAAAKLMENGRNDWKDGILKMETAYKRWHTNFTEEHARISNEWADAYLAGLEEKEQWLQLASEAANQASSEAFLALVGAGAERMSRALDTREPLGIRNAVPETEKLLTGLLNSAGIKNAASALSALNAAADLSPAAVRRGMGGVSLWDARIVKTAASDLARQTNAELAGREAKKLAYNARQAAEEAVNALAARVDSANTGFREKMDKTFIFNGLWRKSGSTYIKDIIMGSTLFEPLITETKTVEAYRDYRMEPVELKTNLNEESLAGLDHFAITALIRNMYLEIDAAADGIFGNGTDERLPIDAERFLSPGKFGAHIGYGPAAKPGNEMGKSLNSMFYDQGIGELGRLMTQFTYWAVIDGRGMAEHAQAPWDKRMWDDRNSGFEAPSLRTTAKIAGAVVLAVASAAATPFSGGASLTGLLAVSALTVAVNTTDELVFGALDIAGGYKTFDEVGFQYGKALLTSSISAIGSAAFSGISLVSDGFFAAGNGIIGTAANAVSSTAAKAAVQTTLTGAQAAATGIINSTINGVTYNHNDGWGFSTDTFNSGLKGTAVSIASSMTSTLTSGTLKAINSGFAEEKLEGFNLLNKNNLGKLNNTLGALTGQGIRSAMGEDFTLNLLNTSLFTNERVNTGLLELSISRNGSAKMNLGTDGADVGINTVISSIKGAMVWNVNNRIAGYTGKNVFKEDAALRAQYGYGGSAQKDQLWEILKGKTILQAVSDNDRGYNAETVLVNGKRVVNINHYQSGMSFKDQMRMALILGHEAYRDGVVTADNYLETQRAVLGHTMMADRMLAGGEKLTLDANLVNDLNAYFAANGNSDAFNGYVDRSYDSSADYWKLTRDGKLEYDGFATLRDADGNVIRSIKDMGLKSDNSIEGALLYLLGVNSKDTAKISAVRAMMEGAGIQHSFNVDSNQWYWKGERDAINGSRGSFPVIGKVDLTAANMGKTISIEAMANLFSAAGSTGGDIIKSVYRIYGSAIDFLNYADTGGKINIANTMLSNYYSSSQLAMVQANRNWLDDVLRNEIDIGKMVKGNARRTQEFDVTTQDLKLKSSSVPNASYFDENHTGVDFGSGGSSINGPGGYWEFYDRNDHRAYYQLYGGDLKMRIQHVNPKELSSTALNSIYGGSNNKLLNYPTESYGSGTGAHIHIDMTMRLPYNGTYARQFVNPETLRLGSRFEYQLSYKDAMKIDLPSYPKNFIRY
jgi:hypothetical protein